MTGLPESPPPGVGSLMDNDVISLTDGSVDGIFEDESTEAEESAVDKFDKFLNERHESEKKLRFELTDGYEDETGSQSEIDEVGDTSGSVAKFDRFLVERKESELDTLLQLQDDLDSEEGREHDEEHDQVNH